MRGSIGDATERLARRLVNRLAPASTTRPTWLTALAWVTRGHPAGGWSTWFDVPGAGDSTVALFSVVVLFRMPDGRGRRAAILYMRAQHV